METETALSSYHIFNAVAEAGNLSKAAKVLTISQPAISRAVSKLEVNDMEELGKIFTSIQLPEIDFEKYTFVACMFQASAPKYIFRKQAVVEEYQKVVLNILLEEIKEGAFPTIYQSYYFWGLYDKLPEKPVTANIKVF